MTGKQKTFYLKFAKAGGTSEEMKGSVAKGEYTPLAFKVLDSLYSIAKKGRKKNQLFALFSSVEGRKLVKGAKSTKRGEKTSEKTASNEVGKTNLGKKKPGFASRYDSRADKTAREIFALGGSDMDVQAALEISQRTYYRWRIENPSFYAAIRAGRDFHTVETVEAGIIKRAKGFFTKEITVEKDEDGNTVKTIIKQKEVFPETKASTVILFNRSPERYSDNPKVKSESEDLKNSAEYMKNLESSVEAVFAGDDRDE